MGIYEGRFDFLRVRARLLSSSLAFSAGGSSGNLNSGASITLGRVIDIIDTPYLSEHHFRTAATHGFFLKIIHAYDSFKLRPILIPIVIK